MNRISSFLPAALRSQPDREEVWRLFREAITNGRSDNLTGVDQPDDEPDPDERWGLADEGRWSDAA